jgi:hypothetical protein
MSDQFENEEQQSLTPDEVRQALLAELDASQQAIAELSNEQLEEAVGGGRAWDVLRVKLNCLTCGLVKAPDYISRFQQGMDSLQENIQREKASRLSPDVRGALGSWAESHGGHSK